jgi:hypothetical protein
MPADFAIDIGGDAGTARPADPRQDFFTRAHFEFLD